MSNITMKELDEIVDLYERLDHILQQHSLGELAEVLDLLVGSGEKCVADMVKFLLPQMYHPDMMDGNGGQEWLDAQGLTGVSQLFELLDGKSL